MSLNNISNSIKAAFTSITGKSKTADNKSNHKVDEQTTQQVSNAKNWQAKAAQAKQTFEKIGPSIKHGVPYVLAQKKFDAIIQKGVTSEQIAGAQKTINELITSLKNNRSTPTDATKLKLILDTAFPDQTKPEIKEFADRLKQKLSTNNPKQATLVHEQIEDLQQINRELGALKYAAQAKKAKTEKSNDQTTPNDQPIDNNSKKTIGQQIKSSLPIILSKKDIKEIAAGVDSAEIAKTRTNIDNMITYLKNRSRTNNPTPTDAKELRAVLDTAFPDPKSPEAQKFVDRLIDKLSIDNDKKYTLVHDQIEDLKQINRELKKIESAAQRQSTAVDNDD